MMFCCLWELLVGDTGLECMLHQLDHLSSCEVVVVVQLLTARRAELDPDDWCTGSV